MRFLNFIYLVCLGLVATAAVIPSPDDASSNATQIEARDAATGYRSVAYFVNWVCITFMYH